MLREIQFTKKRRISRRTINCLLSKKVMNKKTDDQNDGRTFEIIWAELKKTSIRFHFHVCLSSNLPQQIYCIDLLDNIRRKPNPRTNFLCKSKPNRKELKWIILFCHENRLMTYVLYTHLVYRNLWKCNGVVHREESCNEEDFINNLFDLGSYHSWGVVQRINVAHVSSCLWHIRTVLIHLSSFPSCCSQT